MPKSLLAERSDFNARKKGNFMEHLLTRALFLMDLLLLEVMCGFGSIVHDSTGLLHEADSV